jgi:hypothetical protein
MSLSELSQILGNFGELVGAIAVVGTLIFLAIQVRHSKEATEANTRSMDESRRLAMAQTYQARASLSEARFREQASSDYLPAIALKFQQGGVGALTPEERYRLRLDHIGVLVRVDNMYYQYQQGFLDDEYYETNLKDLIQREAPVWDALEIVPDRPSLRAEVERVVAEYGQSE